MSLSRQMYSRVALVQWLAAKECVATPDPLRLNTDVIDCICGEMVRDHVYTEKQRP